MPKRPKAALSAFRKRQAASAAKIAKPIPRIVDKVRDEILDELDDLISALSTAERRKIATMILDELVDALALRLDDVEGYYGDAT